MLKIFYGLESLLGKSPFWANNAKDMLEKNRKGIFTYSRKVWSKISYEGNFFVYFLSEHFIAKEILNKLLEPKPAKRISLNEVLSSRWLSSNLSYEDKKHIEECLFSYEKMC